MFPLQKLNKLFILFFLLVSVSLNAAETKWEVAVVFRGNTEDEQFQKDVDENILEIARITPRSNLKIGIYRELDGQSYIYNPQGTSKKEISLGDVLFRQDLNQIKIPGTLSKKTSSDLDGFLTRFYKDSHSKKALVIYSHGKGADGLRGLKTADLKLSLSQIPRLDLLWFDACFMANVEFLHEMRSFSEYTIASEEAEFSSGLPFQSLNLLTQYENAKDASIAVAKNFIESYSYLKNGKQRNYVSVSSATVSVVENKKIDLVTRSLKWVSAYLKELTPEIRTKLNQVLMKKATMDDKELVDLGILLIELRKLTAAGFADKKLTELIRLLNIDAVKKLKTNPRLHLTLPEKDSLMVYGFNNWLDGKKTDVEENGLFESLLKQDGFILGPNNDLWPFKKTNAKSREIVLTPFAPAVNTFNYYFLDAQSGKLTSGAMSVSRTHDIVESSADSKETPLIYTAYTQQVGTKAERYTGLNITMPGTVASMDYFELEFNQLANWLLL